MAWRRPSLDKLLGLRLRLQERLEKFARVLDEELERFGVRLVAPVESMGHSRIRNARDIFAQSLHLGD